MNDDVLLKLGAVVIGIGIIVCAAWARYEWEKAVTRNAIIEASEIRCQCPEAP